MFIRTLHDSVLNTDHVVLFTVEQAEYNNPDWMLVAHIHVRWSNETVIAPSKFYIHQDPSKGVVLATLNSLLLRINKE